MSETLVPEWVKLLEQDDKLRQAGVGIMYDRVTLLKRVYDDPEYKQAKGEDWVKELDRRVSEYYFDFSQLMLVLKFYPDKQSWVSGSLRTMYFESAKKYRQGEQERKLFEGSDGKEPLKEKRAKPTNSRKDKILQLEQQVHDLQSELTEYKAKYEELKRQHNQLMKRISKKLVDA